MFMDGFYQMTKYKHLSFITTLLSANNFLTGLIFCFGKHFEWVILFVHELAKPDSI